MKTKTSHKLLTLAIAPTQARSHVKKWFAYILAFALVMALVPALLITTLASAPGYPKVDYNGHQYQLFDVSMTWTEAKAYCENLGGYLVTITDEAEQEFLNGLIVQGTKNRYFIGAYRNDRNSNWLWVTGEEFSYTNWKSGEPNSPYEHVIEIFAQPYPTASVGEWNNIMDNGDYGQDVNVREPGYFGLENVGFICEWGAVTATPTPTPTPGGGYNTNGWALPEVQRAGELGLIPGVLQNADLRLPISRAEFAAVAVKLYENLTGRVATPVSPNPFTDTSDPEVLKAYNIGAVNGTSQTTFAPNDRLTREQMATMLTRTLKSAYIPGWTLDTDSQYTLNFTMPAPFADDALISGYARESVYFMFASGVVGGTGNNNFSPRATSTSEQAINTATATREQSLVIAVRMVNILKDEDLPYTQG